MAEQPKPVNLEKFREFLKAVTGMIEDYSIERACMWQLLIEKTNITETQLLTYFKEAKQNPEARERAHRQFSRAWALLEEFGKDALFEAHLLDTPPTDKPN